MMDKGRHGPCRPVTLILSVFMIFRYLGPKGEFWVFLTETIGLVTIWISFEEKGGIFWKRTNSRV